MPVITFVTGNAGKVDSFRGVLGDSDFTIEQCDIALIEPQFDDVRDIARHKARVACQLVGKPVVVQDTGFYIDAWPGFPGAYVRHANDRLGVEGYLKLMSGFKGKQRSCYFLECLAYCDGKQAPIFLRYVEGVLSDTPRGELTDKSTSILHQLFIPKGMTQTIAEMNKETRTKWREEMKKDHWGTRFLRWHTYRGAS